MHKAAEPFKPPIHSPRAVRMPRPPAERETECLRCGRAIQRRPTEPSTCTPGDPKCIAPATTNDAENLRADRSGANL